MVGNGIEADCDIDFKEKNLPSIVSVTAKGVIPSSMGLGDDIHDKMTLTASGRGPLSHLICDGTVTMPELHVPALDFYDVTIDTDFGLIHTDAFHIIDGKLHLGKIELVDKESGESMSITDARDRKGPRRVISQIREDIKEIKERVSGLTP